MMIGGTVKETITLDDKVWVNVVDGSEECAVYLEKNINSINIGAGDALWWQGVNSFWTPKRSFMSCIELLKRGYEKGAYSDITIPRIGYSGADRPQ